MTPLLGLVRTDNRAVLSCDVCRQFVEHRFVDYPVVGNRLGGPGVSTRWVAVAHTGPACKKPCAGGAVEHGEDRSGQFATHTRSCVPCKVASLHGVGGPS